MSLADRVRAMLQAVKPSYGKVDTDESVNINNRAKARRYIKPKGPWQHFTVTPPRHPGRSRKKRNEQRERAKP